MEKALFILCGKPWNMEESNQNVIWRINAVTRRNSSFDFLRILACIAVVFIHANFHYFQNIYQFPSLRIEYIVENAINILTRFSVPCFIMLSGGFILNNEDNRDFKFFYKKTTWKIGVPAFTAAVFFLVIELSKAIIGHSGVRNAIIGFISGFYALWYILVLAGLYILSPFIIRLKTALTDQQYCSLSIFIMVWACMSQAVSNYKLPYTIGTVGAFLGYYMMGDVIINYFKKQVRPIYCFCFSSLLFLITWIIRYVGIDYYTYVTYRNFFSPTIIIASLLILLGFKGLKIQSDYSYLSKLTFHVYIVHTLVLNIIFDLVSRISLEENEIVIIFVVALITITISLIIAVFLDKFWKDRTKWQAKWYLLPLWK